MDRRRWKLAIAGVLAVLVVAGAVAGLAYPRHLIGAASWSVVVVAALFGLGAIARRGLGVELRAGEQIVLGTCAWLAGSGALLALGVASRVPLLVLAAAGTAAAFVDLRARAAAAPPGDAEPGDRIPHLVFLILLSGFLALNLLGTIGTRGNPADDQAAYTAFVKRVLDSGDLIEPFSFRRLSAYGGQTMLHALAALRGDVAAIDLLDRGIFQWIAVIVMLDLAHRRRLHLGMIVVLAVVLLSLWDFNLNSGPMWTGFTCFLGAYGFATRDDIPVRARLVLALAALGAACTLRQNNLVPAGLFGLMLVLSHLRETARSRSWRAAWAAERRTVLLAVAAAAAVVVPYAVAAQLSSGTALYPLFAGTGNPAAPLRPAGGDLLDEVGFFISVVFAPEPIRVWWLLLPLMVIARDARPLRPWRAFLLSSGVGFAFLVHAFMLSDAWNMWRYAFGFLTPLAMAFAVEAAARLPFLERGGADPAPRPESRAEPERRGFALPLAATFLAWLALVVNLVETRQATARRFASSLQGVRAGWVFGTAKRDPRVRSYGELQRAVPEGAPLAVLLDDPWVLDYARNRIVNLDLPGFTAPAPGLPSFTTPAHWRAYFASQGLRYLAFVKPDASSFLYRRAAWIPRMYQEGELFQFMAAHMVDTLDALVALAGSSTVLFDRDGMYAIDLGPAAGPEPDRGPPEAARMDAFLRRISEQELGNNAWQLADRSNLVFKRDGLGPGPLTLPSPDDPEPRGTRGMFTGILAPPHRWLADRTRLRVRGTGREALRLSLWVQTARARTTPLVTVSLDGRTIAEAAPDGAGRISFDVPAPCTGWCDLYLVFSSSFDWWSTAEENRVAMLLELDWVAP
jgi:hypothetical protein